MIRPDCLAMLWTVRPGLPGDALDGQTGAAEYCTGKTEYRKDEKEDVEKINH